MSRTTFVVLLFAGLARGEVTVSTAFEGGSAAVESIDQATQTIRFAPGGDGSRGWPCWWYLRIDGLTKGQQVTLDLGPSTSPVRAGKRPGEVLAAVWSQPDRATVSGDGVHWAQSVAGKRADGRIVYQVTATGEQLWAAWGPPFTPADAEELVKRLGQTSSDAEAFVLATTRGGRKVHGLHVHQKVQSVDPPYGVWIQARQHAWESGGSWVARGLMEWLVSDDVRAIGVRQTCDVYLVPIMDVDNVATGNGGKEAVPQDHNRDWTDAPHWPEVAAAQNGIIKLRDTTGFDLFLDLHNPGAGNKKPFFYIDPVEEFTPGRRERFEHWLWAVNEEGLKPFTPDAPKPTGPKYDPKWTQMSHYWINHHTPDHTLATCLETPWNTRDSTPSGYMSEGKQLGLAIERYFRVNPRK